MQRISESQELPLTQGIVEVDTTSRSIVLHMVSGNPDEHLIIKKVSRDNHSVSLYSETITIDGNDIMIFGLPASAKKTEGTARSIELVSDGTHWSLVGWK